MNYNYYEDDIVILKTWFLYCNSCKTHRDKVTLELDNFDNHQTYAHQCACGAGGWSTMKPKNLIAYELEQAKERDYHDGLEGII